MNDKQAEWMQPVEALTRIERMDISTLDPGASAESAIDTRYGFPVGSIGILTPENTLCEVITEFNIYPIPNTQIWMRGLLNLRGNLIPVYDLSLLLEFSTGPSNFTNLLVLDRAADSIALLSEQLPKVFDLSGWKVLSRSPDLPSGISEFVKKAYAANDRIWIDFDHKSYFKCLKSMVSA